MEDKNTNKISSFSLNGITLSIIKQDITLEKTDAIVNAANSHLIHAGGIAAAVEKRGGYKIKKESREIIEKQKEVQTGTCVTTSSGDMGSKAVIHAVGPIWYSIKNKKLARALLKKTMRSVYIECLKKKFKSVSIPPVSGGIFGYPIELCALDIISEIYRLCKLYKGSLDTIRFVIYDYPTFSVFYREFKKWEGKAEEELEERIKEEKRKREVEEKKGEEEVIFVEGEKKKEEREEKREESPKKVMTFSNLTAGYESPQNEVKSESKEEKMLVKRKKEKNKSGDGEILSKNKEKKAKEDMKQSSLNSFFKPKN